MGRGQEGGQFRDYMLVGFVHKLWRGVIVYDFWAVNTNSEERTTNLITQRFFILAPILKLTVAFFSFELNSYLLRFRGTDGGFILWSRKLLDPSQRFAQKELNLPGIRHFVSFFFFSFLYYFSVASLFIGLFSGIRLFTYSFWTFCFSFRRLKIWVHI